MEQLFGFEAFLRHDNRVIKSQKSDMLKNIEITTIFLSFSNASKENRHQQTANLTMRYLHQQKCPNIEGGVIASQSFTGIAEHI